ncbi:esterase-like activity of phytase family protein [Elstera litoralis]|uniref:esterase-like activity of phytase family protein n=1 Tax=Elstera litoralis TaxID=552518 RepID=UPI0006989FC0|nr:esterase-like activity of phytase family protein [Elstera litoralis]
MSSSRLRLSLSVAMGLVLASGAASAQSAPKFPAVLAGHAAVPADTLIAPPADAGAFFATAGKFTAPDRKRVEAVGTIPTTTFTADPKAPRSSGVSLPVKGQAVQGFSGIQSRGNGLFYILTDNGFGGKGNSPDALLMVHRVQTDWATGKADRQETRFLHDPDKKIPFAIVNENTDKRYLTGADLDPESIAFVGNRLFIGDEFGPYIIEVDPAGKVLAFHETVVDGKPARGPDHYRNGGLPNVPGAVSFEVRRSRGFEPMAASPDGQFLYPAFEGPIFNAETKAPEAKDGKQFVRILQFDVAKGAYTGKSFKYLLEDNANVLGDMAMIDGDTALVIERDDTTEGSKAQACAGEPKLDCFNKPAAFKRVYKIDLAAADAEGFVKKVGYIDLTDIDNPNKAAKIGPNEAKFVLPHLGPEGVAIVDADHIALTNDNNLPYSVGRTVDKADDNEITLLKVSELLRAK